MPERRYQPTIDKDVADHGVRIDREERKPGPKAAAGVSNLDQLKDCVVLYKNPEKAPKPGQVMRWVEDLTIPVYKGYWTPGGGEFIEWTGSDTGTGTLEVDDDLIDPSEWPADQVWLATASVKLTGTFDPTDAYVTGTTPISLGIDPDPQAITLDADPSTSLTFTGGSLVVDFPMDLLEQRANIPRLSIGFTDGATPLAGSSVDASYVFLASAAWLHEPGATPHIHAELISDATTYPSGGTIDVTVHLYPLA